MSNIKSAKLKVFPSVGRLDIYEESYLTTEDNLTKSLRAFQSNNEASWVYSEKREKPFKFVIHGYLFEINEDIPDTAYATIYINNNPVEGDYQLLVTKEGERVLDNNDNFYGLEISETEPTKLTGNIESFTLHLLQNGEIPSTSRLVTYTDSVIDRDTGKTITEEIVTKNISTGDINASGTTTTKTIKATDITSDSSTTKNLTVNTKLTAPIAEITNITSTDIHTGDLTSTGAINGKAITAETADFEDVETNTLTSTTANITTGNITNVNSTTIGTKNLTAEEKVKSNSLETTNLTATTGTITTINSTNFTTANWTVSTKLTATDWEINNSLKTNTFTATTGTITTLNSTTGTITNIKSTGTIEGSEITSSNLTTTNGTVTTLNSTTATITTSNVTNLTVTGTLTPPTNFYGKYTIVLDGSTISIKENY